MTSGVVALVLLAAVMHASWNAALRGGRDRLWSGSAMGFSAALACLLAIPFLPLPLLPSWPHIALSAAIHVGYTLLLVRMYRQGDLGVTYPVARGSSPLLITLGGAFLGGEIISPIHGAGVALVSAGIFTLAFGGGHLHRASIPAALATGVAIAAYSLTDGLGARVSGNAVAYTAWMMLLHGMAMPVVFSSRRRKGKLALFTGRSHRDWMQAAAGGIISLTGYGVVIWAMKHASMGMVSALRETSVLFAAFLGRVFLGEPFTTPKIVAAIMIVAGAICLHH